MPRESFWPSPNDRLQAYSSIAAVAGVVVVAVALLAFFVAFATPTGDFRTHAGSVERFEVGKPVAFPNDEFFLVKQQDGSFVALYSKSTHLGCKVEWREKFEFNGETGWFYDVCHGSIWDENGVRVFGPAPRGLDQFPVEIEGNQVYVKAIKQLLIRRRHP